jgi:hypothetical protein
MASSSACVSDSVQHQAQAVAEIGAVLDARLHVDDFGGLVLADGVLRHDGGHAGQRAQQPIHIGRCHAHLQQGIAGLLGRLAQQGGGQQLAAQRGAQVAHLAPGVGQLGLRNFHVQLLAHGQETLRHLVLRGGCGRRVLGLHVGSAALLHARAARHGGGGRGRLHGHRIVPLVAARKGQHAGQCQQGHA